MKVAEASSTQMQDKMKKKLGHTFQILHPLFHGLDGVLHRFTCIPQLVWMKDLRLGNPENLEIALEEKVQDRHDKL